MDDNKFEALLRVLIDISDNLSDVNDTLFAIYDRMGGPLNEKEFEERHGKCPDFDDDVDFGGIA